MSILFRQWKRVHSCFDLEPRRRPKGRRTHARWIRTAAKHQLVTVTTVAYGFGFRSFRTCWKAYQVYFHMNQVPRQYLFGSSGNGPITVDRSCCPGCCVTSFWADGPCIKLGPLATRPRVGGRPQHLFGRQSIYLYPSRVAMVVGFFF